MRWHSVGPASATLAEQSANALRTLGHHAICVIPSLRTTLRPPVARQPKQVVPNCERFIDYDQG